MAMQFNVSTWARDTDTLKRRVSTLDSAIQGWGLFNVRRNRRSGSLLDCHSTRFF
jgi:hypothetical protein